MEWAEERIRDELLASLSGGGLSYGSPRKRARSSGHSSPRLENTGRRRMGSVEVQDLVSQEREQYIADHVTQTRLGAVLDSVSLRPGDAEEAALWEAARLRVSAATLAAENDALREHSRQLAEQVAALQRNAAAARAEGGASARGARLAAAARIADLEAETVRQRGMLGELAAAAGGLAEENAALGGALAGARSGQRAARADVGHLEERLATLQELCLRGGACAEPVGLTLALPPATTALGPVAAAAQERALAALATPELMAASAPPAGFGCVAPPQRDIVHALRELAALRRERDRLGAQARAVTERASKAEQARAALATEAAATRRAAAKTAVSDQAKLLGALKRIDFLVGQVRERDAALAARDAYAARLEARLLTQHKALQAAARRAPPPAQLPQRAVKAGIAADRPAAGPASPAGAPLRDRSNQPRAAPAPRRSIRGPLSNV
ncbi:hypothetical protein WJX81_005605 [Elliptochloris bilobata]|uniref:Uncharacterized protein n=1 Tax=Elliptochloris bilobata TaxID=381761 RepID=A0AAW1S893_9CHLO